MKTIKIEVASKADKRKVLARMQLQKSTERILFRAELQQQKDRYLFGLVTRMDEMLN